MNTDEDGRESPDRRSRKARRFIIFFILAGTIFAAGMSLSVLISTGDIESLLSGGRPAAIERAPPPAATAAGPGHSTRRPKPGLGRATSGKTRASNAKFITTTSAMHDPSHESSPPYRPTVASSLPPPQPSLTAREARQMKAQLTEAAASPTPETCDATAHPQLPSANGQIESAGNANEGAGEGANEAPTSGSVSSSSSIGSHTTMTWSTSLRELGGTRHLVAFTSDDINIAGMSARGAPISPTSSEATTSGRSAAGDSLFSIAEISPGTAARTGTSTIARPSAHETESSSTSAFGSSSTGVTHDTTTYYRSGSTKPSRAIGAMARSSETFSTGYIIPNSISTVAYYIADAEPAARTNIVSPSGTDAATPSRNLRVTSSSTHAPTMSSVTEMTSLPSRSSGSVGSPNTRPAVSVITSADTSFSTSTLTYPITSRATASGTGEVASSSFDTSTVAATTTSLTAGVVASSTTSAANSASTGEIKTSSPGPATTSFGDGSIWTADISSDTSFSASAITFTKTASAASTITDTPSGTGEVESSRPSASTSATTTNSVTTGAIAPSKTSVANSSNADAIQTLSPGPATPFSHSPISSVGTGAAMSSRAGVLTPSSIETMAPSSDGAVTPSTTGTMTSAAAGEAASSSASVIASFSTAASSSSRTGFSRPSSADAAASSATTTIASSSTGALPASRTGIAGFTADEESPIVSTATKDLRVWPMCITKPPSSMWLAVSTSPRCTMVANEILEEGGSAVDGAIAAQLCEGVGEPQSGGVGGGLYINVYNETSKEKVVFNAREVAWAAAVNDMQYEASQAYAMEGGPAIAVPGAVAGYWEAWKKFGRTPWSRLFDGAIAWCEEGLTVSEALADHLADHSAALWRSEAFREEFFDHTRTLEAGKVVRRSRYCRTLRRIAEHPRSFYEGDLADDIRRDVADEGSTWTAADLSQYAVLKEEPMRYGMEKTGYELLVPFWPSEAMSVAVALQYMDWRVRLNASTVSATTAGANFEWHRTVECLRYGITFKRRIGDPNTRGDNNVAGRSYVDAQHRFKWMLTAPYHISDRFRAVKLYHLEPAMPDKDIVPEDAGERAAVQTSAVDNSGLTVSASGSIGFRFGSKRMGRRTGIIFNSAMADFTKIRQGRERPNWISPGARPSSPLVPAIVIDRNGSVLMVVGCGAGTRGLSALTWTIFNAMMLKMSLRDAIATPRFHPRPWSPEIEYEAGVTWERVLDLASRFHEPVEVARIGFVTGLLKHSNSTWESCTDGRNQTSTTSLPYWTAAPTGSTPTRTTPARRWTTASRRPPPTTEPLGATLASSVFRRLHMSSDPIQMIAASVPGGMQVGDNIRVRGIVDGADHRWFISIQQEVRNSRNKALVLTFNRNIPDHDVVVRHSIVDNRVVYEDRYGRPSPTFQFGQPFEARIRMDVDRFRIFVAGEHYTDYAYHLPVNILDTIAVYGGLSQVTIEYF